VRHDGDDGRQAAVADRQPYGVGAGRGQAAAGVLQHRRGDVDAERSPAQSAYAAGVNAGAAGDLQAGASSPAQQAAERGIEAIVVSNHGGRQLDGAPATLDALPEVVDASTISGEADALLRIVAADMHHFERVLEQIGSQRFVARTKSVLVLSALLRRPVTPLHPAP